MIAGCCSGRLVMGDGARAAPRALACSSASPWSHQPSQWCPGTPAWTTLSGPLGCRSRAVCASQRLTTHAPRPPPPCPPPLAALVGCPVPPARPWWAARPARSGGWTADPVSGSSSASRLIVGVGTERQPQGFPLPTQRPELGPPPSFHFKEGEKQSAHFA